ncbi:MAG TPA: prolipoprotein diacylglyceryl transferase [Caulobacteraceae bacterium]
MTFPDLNPVLLQLGPFAIRWYALGYVAGILLGWRYAVTLVKTPRLWGAQAPTLTPEQIDDLILWITVGVIAGGRLGSILFYSPSTLWRYPLDVLKIWEGGMSFHGGLLGVTLALLLFSRLKRLDVLKIADLVAPCVPFGLFLVRIANFINAELWGRVTDVPWAIRFCNQRILEAHAGHCPAGMEPRHPSQLYEAALEGLVLFLILRWATHRAGWLQRRGGITGLFLLCYALFRISLENVRQPDLGAPTPYGLTMGMMLSVPMLLAGAFLIWRSRRDRAVHAEAVDETA